MRPERPEAHRLDERVKIRILRERVGLTQGAIKTENSRSLSRPPPRPGRPPPAPAPAWRDGRAASARRGARARRVPSGVRGTTGPRFAVLRRSLYLNARSDEESIF